LIKDFYLASNNNKSISSINITAGLFSLAIANNIFIILLIYSLFLNIISHFSGCSKELDKSSEEETEKNVPPASVAQAFAIYVFPVPGG